MTVAIAQIAQEWTMTPSELERRSLEAFIERERRLVNLDIADLQDRYGVRTALELANRIEIKAVYSHPAWEEMIEWERLEAYLERLINWQEESYIPDDPQAALREFLNFVVRQLEDVGE